MKELSIQNYMNSTPLNLDRLREIYSIRALTEKNLVLFMIGITVTNLLFVLLVGVMILSHKDEVNKIKMRIMPNSYKLERQDFYQQEI